MQEEPSSGKTHIRCKIILEVLGKPKEDSKDIGFQHASISEGQAEYEKAVKDGQASLRTLWGKDYDANARAAGAGRRIREINSSSARAVLR